MRLLLAASAFALLAGPAATQPSNAPPPTDQARPQTAQPAAAKPDCLSISDRQAVLPAVPPRARRLDELPPANLELTVQREIDGCIRPVIVRYDVAAGRR